MYYTVRKTDREWYGSLPERFDDDYLYWWCEENGEDYEYMLDMIVIDDDRDDYEMVRDVIRPIRDRLSEVYNALIEDENYPYDEIAKVLEVDYMSLEDLYNMNDYAHLLYRGLADGTKDERIRQKIYSNLATIEDVLYDVMNEKVKEVADKVTRG